MDKIKLAFDRGSVRSTDADGRLHIARTHISKAAVNPYYGKEIPGWQELGLDPEKIYRMFRDPVELERGADTFARLPVQIDHVHTTADEPRPDLVVGAIGSNVIFDNPYLDADMSIWDSKAIAGIESGQLQELSCAYRYVPVMESGEYKGVLFDGRMTQIKGSHVCIVETGRAGSDVLVADNNPFAKVLEMSKTKTGKALIAALGAMSPVLLAKDAKLAEVVGGVSKKTFKKDDVKKALIALDASLDSNKLDAVLDAILDTEDKPEAVETPAAAADESPADKVKGMLKGKVDDAMIEEICKMMGKPAADADMDDVSENDEQTTSTAMDADEDEPAMKPKEVKAAMDAAIKKSNDSLRKQLQEAEQARRDVRPTVGDVSVAMDSASSVYGFALDQLKVDHKGISDVTALRAMHKLASEAKAATSSHISATIIAQDSAGMVKEFPGAARFSHA